MIPSHFYPLENMPGLVQCGLCVHGSRARETFCQRGLWSLHVYHYAGCFIYRGKAFQFESGTVSLIPPDEEVTWHFPQHAPHYYAHFKVSAKGGTRAMLPLLREPKEGRAVFLAPVDEMIGFFPDFATRANVRLWDLLHSYAAGERVAGIPPTLHPGVQIALSIIRNNPAGRLKIADLARQIGMSHNQLTVLFNKHFGCGVSQFIRKERVGRACELLRHSALSIKSIALECGFSDLQYFNKIIRSDSGKSPSALRHEAESGRGFAT